MYWPLIGGFIAVVLVTLLVGWLIDISRGNSGDRRH
jgi:hypothetical protein